MTAKELLHHILTYHRGKALGTSAGLTFAVLVLTLGFWRAFFVALCIGVGAFIGSLHDRRESFLLILDKILPNLLNK
jgi:uncharacterized membrane protein